MPKHFYLLFVSTLVIGMLTGAYVRFLDYTPTAEPLPEPEISAVLIVATQYGGCERVGCSMYRLSDTGEYTFVRYGVSGGERFTGTLTSAERSRILTLLGQTSLPTLQESMFTGTCPITYDGLAYRYEIEMRGATYELDSCRENLTGPFVDALENLFVQLYEKHRED